MNRTTLAVANLALLALLAGCGNDRNAGTGAAEDPAVSNARALSATSAETTEPGSGDDTPMSQPENTEPVAI